MSYRKITTAADEMLVTLYKEFSKKEKCGVPRKTARTFPIKETYSIDILRELKNAGFIRKIGWDQIALEDAGIVYMENRPGLIEKTLNTASKIKSAIPFA